MSNIVITTQDAWKEYINQRPVKNILLDATKEKISIDLEEVNSTTLIIIGDVEVRPYSSNSCVKYLNFAGLGPDSVKQLDGFKSLVVAQVIDTDYDGAVHCNTSRNFNPQPLSQFIAWVQDVYYVTNKADQERLTIWLTKQYGPKPKPVAEQLKPKPKPIAKELKKK